MTTAGTMVSPIELQAFSREACLDDGTRLHYYEAGSPGAAPLVLIHGLGDEADTWRHVLLPLSRQHRVIALDLPGFGQSDHPRRAYTPVFFARTVADLLAKLGIARAGLVGNSMGATIAQRLALGRPELVERLILIGGALPIESGWPAGQLWLFLAPGIGEAIYTSLRRSQDQAYATLRPYYADLDALPPEDREFLRDRVWARVWNAGQRRAFLSALRWLTIERASRAPALRARLAHLDIPTLLIWGKHDQIVPRAVGEQMAALLLHAQLRVIDGCGHLPQQECPQELVETISSLDVNPSPLPQIHAYGKIDGGTTSDAPQ